MTTYKVNYTTNQPEAKGTLTVFVEGSDMEDAKARFERTSTILAGSMDGYEATIITISEAKKSPRKAG